MQTFIAQHADDMQLICLYQSFNEQRNQLVISLQQDVQ